MDLPELVEGLFQTLPALDTYQYVQPAQPEGF